LTAPGATAASGIAGRIVFLDPGHNGANDASINRQVPTGRGGTKECQTSGTTTDNGFPEHTFNWEVVLLIRQELTQLGVRTANYQGASFEPMFARVVPPARSHRDQGACLFGQRENPDDVGKLLNVHGCCDVCLFAGGVPPYAAPVIAAALEPQQTDRFMEDGRGGQRIICASEDLHLNGPAVHPGHSDCLMPFPDTYCRDIRCIPGTHLNDVVIQRHAELDCPAEHFVESN